MFGGLHYTNLDDVGLITFNKTGDLNTFKIKSLVIKLKKRERYFYNFQLYENSNRKQIVLPSRSSTNVFDLESLRFMESKSIGYENLY